MPELIKINIIKELKKIFEQGFIKSLVKKEGFKCERCKHEWIPNNINQEPTVCPRCKSPYWNKPRRQTTKK